MIEINDKDKIEILLRALQDSLPSAIKYKNKEVKIEGKNKLACNRAIWYIIVKGYGIGSATQIAAQKYRKPRYLLEKTLRSVFPKNYFVGLEKGKNKHFLKKML